MQLCKYYKHNICSGVPGHNRLGHCQFGFSIALTDVSNFVKLIANKYLYVINSFSAIYCFS